jgi:UDP-N-acetylglucosamine/UDP-N-acetylgalactosamine diphosphorylase
MTDEQLIQLLAKHGQNRLRSHFLRLSTEQKREFLRNIGNLDFDLLFSIYKECVKRERALKAEQLINQAEVIALPTTTKEEQRRREAREAGESLLRAGKVAVLIVAGGQGSRLGFTGPKGCFPVSPVKSKTLFQIFAEQVKALSTGYRNTIPLLFMTSVENHEETVSFFEESGYFGLDKVSVFFFSQAVLPSITPEGALILRDATHLSVNPDGHGGSLNALHRSGILSKLLGDGFTQLFYCQVDNPLVRIADPIFLGFHAITHAEVSTKVVRRANIEEKVGVYVSRNGRDAIVEYSDMGREQMSALDGKDNILYWAGNTAIHCFSLPFLRRLTEEGFALPYHCAAKEVEGMAEDGTSTKMTGWKFETFVFDTIPLAQRTCCVEVLRQEEFAPIKNNEGIDSPATASQAMMRLHQRWLQSAGIIVPEGAKVEISPLFALDEEELRRKSAGKYLTINGDIYLEGPE